MKRLIILALVAFSCNPGKQLTKAEARLAQAGRLPSICAERFPIKDTTYIVDTLIKTDTLLSGEYIFDTLRVNDTIRINDTLLKIKYKPLEIVQVKTLTKVVQVENLAKSEAMNASVKRLEAQNSILSSDLGRYKGLAKSRLNWLILLCAAIVGYSIRKPVMAFIKWNLQI